MFKKNKLLSSMIGLSLLSISNISSAGGFQILENGSYNQGMAFAGVAASTNDISSIFYNPANLGTIKQNSFYIGSSYIIAKSSMSNAQSTHTVEIDFLGKLEDNVTVTGSTSEGNIAENSPVPHIYAGWIINDKINLGLSLTSPFDAVTNYSESSVLRFMSQETSVKTLNFTPMISYKVNKKLFLGFGVMFQYAKVKYSNFDGVAFPVDDTFLSIGADLNPATTATNIKMDSIDIGYLVGITYLPFEGTTLGISYRSEIKHNLHGSGDEYLISGDLGACETINIIVTSVTTDLCNSSTTAYGRLVTPAMLSIGAVQKITDKLDIRAGFIYTFWGNAAEHFTVYLPEASANETTLLLDWKNSYVASLGFNYILNDKWQIRTGIAHDTTPTVDATRDTRMPDSDRVIFAIGASYQATKSLRIDVSYEHYWFKDTSINLTETVGDAATDDLGVVETNTSSADYKTHADVISLSVNYTF